MGKGVAENQFQSMSSIAARHRFQNARNGPTIKIKICYLPIIRL